MVSKLDYVFWNIYDDCALYVSNNVVAKELDLSHEVNFSNGLISLNIVKKCSTLFIPLYF